MNPRLSFAQARVLFPKAAIPKPKPQKKPPSSGEELFAMLARHGKLPAFEREWSFALDIERYWRFDFAWPTFRVAVEIEGYRRQSIGGVPYALGRHCTVAGFTEDCVKYATANYLGWQVNRFTPVQVRNGEAVTLTRLLLASRGAP